MMFLFLVLAGFLIGGIPSGYLSMRYFTGADIRTLGTGSATVTAVMIHGGRIPGTVALLLEIAKAIRELRAKLDAAPRDSKADTRG